MSSSPRAIRRAALSGTVPGQRGSADVGLGALRGLLGEGDAVTRLRARVLVVAGVVGALACAGFAIQRWLSGETMVARIATVAAAGVLFATTPMLVALRVPLASATWG